MQIKITEEYLKACYIEAANDLERNEELDEWDKIHDYIKEE